MRTLLLLSLLLASSVALGAEPPAGSTVVYSGTADVPGYQAMYFRDASGMHWRWFIRNADGVVETKTSYSSLGIFRNVLLTIDDRAGMMGAGLWRVDSDGDVYSDMLEYLTNGDPYNGEAYPTEPRILYFDGGQSFESILPLPDMSGSGGDDSGTTIPTQDNLISSLLFVLSFTAGLHLWRLTVLSMSRRNIL